MTIRTSIDNQVEQVGGLVRVTHGRIEDQPGYIDAPHQPTRTGNESFALDMGTGQMTSRGVTRYTVGQEPAPTQSVMATLRHENGYDTVETIPGNPASRTVIDTAVRDGLVRKSEKGFYEDVKRENTGEQVPSPQAKQPDAERPTLLTQEELGNWQQDIAPLSQASYDAAVAGVIAQTLKGESGDISGIVARLASENGIEPELAQEYAVEGYHFHRNAVVRDLMAQGYCTEANVSHFFDSIKTHPLLARAMQEVALEHKTSTFRQLAIQWSIKNPQ